MYFLDSAFFFSNLNITFLSRQAYLQFATEDEAKAMARFYNSNVTASVCGRSVRVSHSMTYPTIQVSRASALPPAPQLTPHELTSSLETFQIPLKLS